MLMPLSISHHGEEVSSSEGIVANGHHQCGGVVRVLALVAAAYISLQIHHVARPRQLFYR